MPQCKKDGCRDNAVYNRRWGHKRYCETHGHAYADKRDTALAARAKMNDCESGVSPSCEWKVHPSRWDQGKTICAHCEEAAQELNRRHEYETRKRQRYDDANTVDDLKRWISDYM